jgi:hypothetical protein
MAELIRFWRNSLVVIEKSRHLHSLIATTRTAAADLVCFSPMAGVITRRRWV